jgi:hypothetical protein
VAGEQHLYLVASGTYADTTDTAEHWQFGTRLALVFGTVSDQGTLPDNWTVNPATDTDSTGGWDYVSNFSVSGPSGFSFNPLSYLEDYGVPTAIALFGTQAINEQCRLTEVKLSPINDSGHVVGGMTAYGTNATGPTGGKSGNMLPLQNSVVCSLGTPQTGRKGRGRFYLPATSTGSLDSEGNVSSSAQTSILAAAVGWLEGLSYSAVSAGDAHVRPIVTGKPWTHYGMVTKVRVGNRVDTQRRRRRQLVETYAEDTPSYG